MSMDPQDLGDIPEETVRVVRAASLKRMLATRLRNDMGAVSRDEHVVDLSPERGQPASAPWRLALVPIVPFVEHLTDRHAAENCGMWARW